MAFPMVSGDSPPGALGRPGSGGAEPVADAAGSAVGAEAKERHGNKVMNKCILYIYTL